MSLQLSTSTPRVISSGAKSSAPVMAISSANRVASWWTPGGATTSRAPARSGQNSSQTDTSKLNGVFYMPDGTVDARAAALQ